MITEGFAARALVSSEVLSARAFKQWRYTMATHPATAYSMTQQDSSLSNFRFPAWQREYEASIHESDPKKLLERIHAAEAAIFGRLQDLTRSDSPDHKAEQQAIADALSALRVLKRDKLQFPDWQTQ